MKLPIQGNLTVILFSIVMSIVTKLLQLNEHKLYFMK